MVENRSTEWFREFYRQAILIGQADEEKREEQQVNLFPPGVRDLREERQLSFPFGCELLLKDRLIRGDFCHLYFGEYCKEGHQENVCLKVPFASDINDLMANEAEVLRRIKGKMSPTIIDSITLDDGRIANVIRNIEEGFDLVDVMRLFPEGIPEEPFSWILGRYLYALGLLHKEKIVHAAVEPGNMILLSDEERHNGILVDYLLSVVNAHQPGAQYSGITAFSAPEVVEAVHSGNPKPAPHPKHDMYSLGKVMLTLLRGKPEGSVMAIDRLHPRIAGIVQSMIELDPDKRASDAWKLWHQLRKVRKELVGGEIEFVPFIMPIHRLKRR